MNPTVSSRPGHDQALVDRLWNYANVLRDNGTSGLELIEQLSSLIVLKRAHEQRQRPLNGRDTLGFDAWEQLTSTERDSLIPAYEQILDQLAARPGTLGLLFRRAQNRIPDLPSYTA